jgi:hypothetical protein
MNTSQDNIEGLKERLEQLRTGRVPGDDASLTRSDLLQKTPVLPSTAPGFPRSDAPGALELLVLRDRYIRTELLRLQRTLSRQTFRGAESARRLVRRLARKAEQNVSEIEALMGSTGRSA